MVVPLTVFERLPPDLVPVISTPSAVDHFFTLPSEFFV